MTTTSHNTPKTRTFLKPAPVFLFYWVALFLLYLPTAQAGRVGDFPLWVHFLTSVDFWGYINRSYSGLPGLYQFTQIVTYVFYQAFGANAWLWHLLFITMQAANATLLFVFFRRLFVDASVRNASMASFAGALLFCFSPYISEVVVWEPAFHYLLGLMLMLVVLCCAQRFMLTQKAKYAWSAALFFFLSTYSIELFYLTPVFVVSLCIYYRIAVNKSRRVFTRSLLFLAAPQVALFLAYFAVLYAMYHSGIAHIGKAALRADAINLSKGPKYIFHILFMGRFFSDAARAKVYRLCESAKVLFVFYGAIAILLVASAIRFRLMAGKWKISVLLFVWVLCALALVLPLWFPDTGLVIYDRYTYALDALLFMFLSLLLTDVLPKYVYMAAVAAIALLNIRFTHIVNAYWQQSARIVNKLVYTFPDDPSKKVLLLDLPECLRGVQMIGTRDDGEFRMMYNAIMPRKITNPVYDVEAFYMLGTNDGAHVNVLDDSTVRVTLNQWGSYWLYYGFGASSYENDDFKVDMRDVGHWYDLILKHPASEYLLLYNAGSEWKTVDFGKKNVDQY